MNGLREKQSQNGKGESPGKPFRPQRKKEKTSMPLKRGKGFDVGKKGQQNKNPVPARPEKKASSVPRKKRISGKEKGG